MSAEEYARWDARTLMAALRAWATFKMILGARLARADPHFADPPYCTRPDCLRHSACLGEALPGDPVFGAANPGATNTGAPPCLHAHLARRPREADDEIVARALGMETGLDARTGLDAGRDAG